MLVTLVRPLADSNPTPTKTISQGEFEQAKRPWGGERTSISWEPSSAQDWFLKRLQMIRALDV